MVPCPAKRSIVFLVHAAALEEAAMDDVEFSYCVGHGISEACLIAAAKMPRDWRRRTYRGGGITYIYVYVYMYIYIYIYMCNLRGVLDGGGEDSPRLAAAHLHRRGNYVYKYMYMCICVYVYIHGCKYIYIYITQPLA